MENKGIRNIDSKIVRCKNCNKKIRVNRNHQKYCTTDCRNLFFVKKRKDALKSLGYTVGLGTGIRGAISELKVCSDLLERGFEVFRSVTAPCSCDLAILKKGKLLRVEVRSNIYPPVGKKVVNRRNVRAEILASVLPNKIVYYPPLEDCF